MTTSIDAASAMSEAVGDHLDASPSETVRRHAATFRRVRLARQAADTAARDRLCDEPSDEIELEVPAREATSDEVPASARRLATTARTQGWAVSVVYSRGAQDTVSVRCRRGDRACAGLWRDGRFAAGVVKAELLCGMRMTRKANTKGLRGFLEQAPLLTSPMNPVE